MRRVLFAVGSLALLCAMAAAQAPLDHANGPAAHAAPAAASDPRALVPMPQPLAQHMLANMRDHLAALQEIQAHLGTGQMDVAARIAETRLGFSSLGLHGAHEVARFMPPGMQDAGSAMHKAASRLALVTTDAAATGEMAPVFSALAAVTGACVGCHAGYRIK
ncbi:hypothetical protein [Xanthobacter sp. KR7-225]|uniref:hypothetical protein n=1 Tax=Xanthobacter sp. KR7-225 TaxID=3156613 RepID=UPI0032B41390